MDEVKEEVKNEEKKAVEKPGENGEAKSGRKRLSRRERIRVYQWTVFALLAIGAIAVIAFFFLGVGIKNTDRPVGYWKITEASSGEVVMKDGDAEAMGLRDIGSFKLNRGGDCVITYLGKSSKGTWRISGSGKIVIEYGEGKKIVGEIDTKTDVMTAKDNESMVYKLEK